MQNRSSHGQAASQHYDEHGRVKFKKLSDLAQFFRDLYFYIDKAEDIFGFLKREIGFGADKAFLQGWLFLSNILSFFRSDKPTPPAIKIFNDFFERLIGNLSPLSIFITVFQGLLHICKAIYVLGLSNESPYTRTIQFFMGLAAISLIAISITIFTGAISVSAPILFAAGAARGIVEHALIGFGFIYERFFSTRSNVLSDRKAVLTKKYIKDKAHFNNADIKELMEISREQREGNERILNKVQGTWFSTGFLVASVLLFTPAAPAGTALFIALTAFAIADAVVGLATRQNTTRLVARGLNALAGLFMKKPPFNLEVKTEKDIRLELRSAELAYHEKRERLAMQNEDVRAPIIKRIVSPAESPLPTRNDKEFPPKKPVVPETRKGKEKEESPPKSPMQMAAKEATSLQTDLPSSSQGTSPSFSSPVILAEPKKNEDTGKEKGTYASLTQEMMRKQSDVPAEKTEKVKRALASSAPATHSRRTENNIYAQQSHALHYSPSIARLSTKEDGDKKRLTPSPRQI